MTKRALLIALSDYGGFAPKLTAPARELVLWQERLGRAPFNFDSVTPLADPVATKPAVIRALNELLTGVSKHDQRLVVFMGHGTVAKGQRRGNVDQSLLVYPSGGRGWEEAAVKESDVDTILAAKRPQLGAAIAFVLDCCFAANYGDLFRFGKASNDAIPLFVPPPDDIWTGTESLRVFGTFAAASERADVERPIVFAASGELEAAYEIRHGSERRLLFTKRLLEALEQRHDTFERLRARINPLHPIIQQRATLRGNTARQNEKFPGQPEERRMRSDTQGDNSIEELTPATAKAPASATTAADAATNSITLRILGFGCFVDSRDPENDPYKARIVMPYDEGKYVQGPDRHFGCVEIAHDDIDGMPVGPSPVKTYFRGGVQYSRWLLDGHTVSIQTGDFDQPFERSPLFNRHAPTMTVLCPEIRPRNPRPECFAPVPRPDLFAAFVDIPSGSVDIGPLEDQKTVFQRRTKEITWGPENTPISVKVNVPVITEVATLLLRPYPTYDEPELVVRLKPGSTVLVANAREVDIEGNGTGATPSEQFLLYYKLATHVPDDPPLPLVIGVPIDACSVTSWP